MKQESRLKKIILPIFIASIMVFSIFGYMANRSDNPEEAAYNFLKFVKSDNGWLAYKDNKKIIIQTNPKDLKDIQEPKLTLQELNSAQKIYLSFNPEDNIYQALNSFVQQIKPLLNTFTQACTKDVSKCSNLPLKTCSDATDIIKVIQIQENNQTRLEYTNNCLIIQGKSEDLIKEMDKLTLILNGI